MTRSGEMGNESDGIGNRVRFIGNRAVTKGDWLPGGAPAEAQRLPLYV